MPITYVKLSDAGDEPPPPASPQMPLEFQAARDATLPAPDDLHSVPILLIQLQDELSRSRRREALWLSIIVHMIVIATLLFGPKIFPRRQVVLATPADMLNNHELTYLEQAPDRQNAPKPRDTDIISDKNRIAMSRTPKLNRDALKKILDSSRPGAPGVTSPAPSPSASQQQVAQAAPQQQPQQSAPPPPADSQQPSALELQRRAQAGRNVFGNSGAMSAGSLIDQAARATAGSRGGGSVGGGGDYGAGISGGGAVQGNMEVLSDTMGVDFGPYLSRVLHDVKQNWYALIPEVARAPLLRKGKVSIEFAITKDGKVAGMRLIGASGDTSLDRAAWGGISASNPFPPLPYEFRGDYLALRFHFFYNPDKNDLR
jgi:TonB family protein